MFVENTLFQSESWQRHAVLARSLPPLVSFPYTDHELKLFRLIVEWHLASFHFKTIIPSDCLIRFDDLLEFYGALRKLRDSVSANSFTRAIPSMPMPPPMPVVALPKQRPSTSANSLAHSFELPTLGGHPIAKAHVHPRSQSVNKIYPSHPPSNILLQQSTNQYSTLHTRSPAQPYKHTAMASSKGAMQPTAQVVCCKRLL
jgi:hypothetical protein